MKRKIVSAFLIYFIAVAAAGIIGGGDVVALVALIFAFLLIYGGFGYLIYRFAKGKVKIILFTLLTWSLIGESAQVVLGSEVRNIIWTELTYLCLIVCAVGYAIHRFAQERLQKILYFVLAASGIVWLVFLTQDYGRDLILGVLWIAMYGLLWFVGYKVHQNVKSQNHSIRSDSKRIARLKGYHLYGLSANEGETVSAELYQDRIVFRYAADEVESVEKDRIVSISSHTQQEIVGRITTEKRKGSVASAMAALNGDWGAALFFGNRPSTYETKNKVETNWFLEVDTTTISIILQVKSMSALRQLVDLCNRTLQPSRDYAADDYDEELDGCKEQTPSLKEQVNIAAMDGQQFEIFCAQLLQDNGWINVIHTPNSGDQGVDIIAEKDGIKYAIQCKHYSQPVGNTAVQEVTAGKQFYHCHVAVVLTNSIFTKSATDLAKANNVLLWDNYKLDELIKIAGYTGHS